MTRSDKKEIIIVIAISNTIGRGTRYCLGSKVLTLFEQSDSSRVFLLLTTSHAAAADELLSGGFGSNLGNGYDAIVIVKSRLDDGGGFYADVRAIIPATVKDNGKDVAAAETTAADEPVILMSHTHARTHSH